MTKTRWLFFLIFLSVVVRTEAQDVWLVDKQDSVELYYGHETPEVYNPAKVKEIKAYDITAKPAVVTRLSKDEAFVLKKNPKISLVTIVFDNGYWVQSSSGELKNVSKETARSFPASHHPIKMHKSIYSWTERWSQPVGLQFEIVPLQNPFAIAPPGLLKVQVFFDGRPLPDVDVEFGAHGDQANKKKTDAKGIVSVPEQQKGEQFLSVDYTPKTPPQPGDATVSYSTSLRWELR